MAKAKVFIVDRDFKADYKVFFVEHAHQEQNAGIIANGTLVQREHQADVKVFLVDRDFKATIRITRKNFPR